jgi:protein Tob/BTG
MHIEVRAALNFIISHLDDKLPRIRLDIFEETLERKLIHKFDKHWYPDKPLKGSAFRCLRIGNPIDPIIKQAAQESDISVNDIIENLPEGLSLWIDPEDVSYKIGEYETTEIIYDGTENATSATNRKEIVTRVLNPEAGCFTPLEEISSCRKSIHSGGDGSVSSSIDNYSLSPPSSFEEQNLELSFLHQRSNTVITTTFSAATFAQTRFGSTKLKKVSGKNNLSFSKFSNYIKQRVLRKQFYQHQQQDQQWQQYQQHESSQLHYQYKSQYLYQQQQTSLFVSNPIYQQHQYSIYPSFEVASNSHTWTVIPSLPFTLWETLPVTVYNFSHLS